MAFTVTMNSGTLASHIFTKTYTVGNAQDSISRDLLNTFFTVTTVNAWEDASACTFTVAQKDT